MVGRKAQMFETHNTLDKNLHNLKDYPHRERQIGTFVAHGSKLSDPREKSDLTGESDLV